jgi:hypothetical protein
MMMMISSSVPMPMYISVSFQATSYPAGTRFESAAEPCCL